MTSRRLRSPTARPTRPPRAGTITFAVSLTNPADHNVTVAYHLVNGTAVAGSDFSDAGGGTVTILAGQTIANITVNVINDNVFESPEAFTVKLDSATYDLGGANTALGISDRHRHRQHRRQRHGDLVAQRRRGRHRRQRGELHGAPGRHAAGGRDGNRASGAGRYSTTSADHASFTAAVIAAIGARTDLGFDAGTGTLTYTGTGSPMPNLVISLAAVNDGLVEGPEQYYGQPVEPRQHDRRQRGRQRIGQTTIIRPTSRRWSI